MKLWPFKRNVFKTPKREKFDSLVWEANTLAKVSLMTIVNRFPEYGPIIDSNLVEVWNCLMTIAMTGVSVHAEGKLSNAQVQHEVQRILDKKWQGGSELFDDYYEYTELRTKETGASWSGVSAMWVADNLRLHSKANATLKRNASELNFINRLSSFMNISFGSSEARFSNYLGVMALYAEKDMGIDMGLGTQGTKKDSEKKIAIIHFIFKSFAQKTAELIATKQL